MDPITTSQLVQDRVAALQQTADELRLERRLRSPATTLTPSQVATAAVHAVPSARPRPADTQRGPVKADDCVPVEPAA